MKADGYYSVLFDADCKEEGVYYSQCCRLLIWGLKYFTSSNDKAVIYPQFLRKSDVDWKNIAED